MRRLHLVIPLLLGATLVAPAPAAHAQVAVGLSITLAPPILPIYVQPAIPAPGYIWTPGYWAWGVDGYYWVPGTWVLPPAVGLLWTPGYWGWAGGVYAWNAGYWGPTVGFYGGINYGFGYTGSGYWGGRWDGGHFAYNSAVNNFGGAHFTNVYNRTVAAGDPGNRVAFNGGSGGTTARPTAQQEALAHAQHVAPTALQVQHERMAAADPQLRASVNQGRPPIAATARPAAFAGRGVEASRPATTTAGAGARPAGATGVAAARPVGPGEARPALRGPANEAHPAVEAGHPAFAAAHPAVPANHAAVPADHGPAPAYHAAAPAYHAAAPAYHAAAPAYHAAAPAYHAAAPAYHAAAPAYHAAAPAYHAAAPAYHAAARPAAPASHAAPRQQESKRG
jgi:hypothetical protein